jgi:predicted NBD/HSP70 family sugar kinase
MIKIVFDVGATNTRVARADNRNLSEILRRPTPASKSDWTPHLLQMVAEISNGDEVEMSVGGVATVEGENIMALTLPNARVFNDALLAGFGEAVMGAGKDSEIVGYVGFGTGIGTARIANKKIDSNGLEAGHHIIDSSTGESWEEKVSGRLLQMKYDKYPQSLEKEVYNSILFWSPDVLVMGGSLMTGKEGFKIEDIVQAVQELNRDLPGLPPIRLSELGDSAGLYGALAIIENGGKER